MSARGAESAGWGYQACAVRASDHEQGRAHETLLKASMPVDRGLRPGEPTAASIAVLRMVLMHAPVRAANAARSSRNAAGRQWVVLTSWDESGQPRFITVDVQRVFSSSYAAVPTAGGWLIIQL